MSNAIPATTGPLAHRMACALGACALLLIAAGGLVTTYRVGMAVPDWPTTFGYGMFSYPLERMLENFGVTIEHTHRLVASFVGLLSIATLLAAARTVPSAARRFAWGGLLLEAGVLGGLILGAAGAGGGDPLLGWPLALLAGAGVLLVVGAVTGRSSAFFVAATIAHAAVVGQGLLGGSRVLANDSTLAFLHGACAQLVYAAVAAVVVTSSPAWTRTRVTGAADESGARPRALVAVAIVFGQIVAGAWLRHSGRSDAMGLHLLLALAATVSLIVLARALKDAPGAARQLFARLRLWIHVLLGAQIVLGLITTLAIYVLSGGFAGAVSLTEAIAATAHVAVGASLLATTLATVLWSRRTLRPIRGATGNIPELREQHA